MTVNRARAVIDAMIDDAQGRDMSWPDDWCATWADAGVGAIWGVSLLGNAYAGAFAENEEAALAAYPFGIGVMLARRMRVLGWVRVPVAMPPTGAVVAIRVGGEYGHSVGLSIGGGWIVRRSSKGVTFHRSADDAVAAWMPAQELR